MAFKNIIDIRDGLNPASRQIFSILQETLKENNFENSTRALEVVADRTGIDIDEIYDALVDTTRPRSILPLVDGLGNFGFPPAHHNYSMIRLSNFFEQITGEDLIKDFNRPLSMPFPYAIVNGTIGYNYSNTKIPAHNLGEVIDATIALVKNPESGTRELLQYIKGPDLLIGGFIENPDDLIDIYENGIGTIKILVTPENLGGYNSLSYGQCVEETKNYCDWYALKSRKLRLQEAVKITIDYNAFVSNGKETKYMGLKEMLLEFINHFKTYRENLTDEEICTALAKYKKESVERRTCVK